MVAGSILWLSNFSSAQMKEKILIITGGHDFEQEAFFAVFKDMPNVEYKSATQPEANQWYASSQIDNFDVLVFYDMVQKIEDSQKQDFIDLLNKGKGIVFLHHSLVSYQEWDKFEKIIGGRYVLKSVNHDSSTYQHDVNIPVTIADKEHPITKGMDDFVIHDEVYGNFKVLPSVHPLLTTNHSESGEIIGWTNAYGKSRIVYIQLGHDHFAYENPNFRRLVKQSIDWVGQKE
jgi:type 1 glutamine amidotransferase